MSFELSDKPIDAIRINALSDTTGKSPVGSLLNSRFKKGK